VASAPAAAVNGAVTIDAVGKVYGETVVALDGCTLDIAAGEFLALVGPSGCGKSTLLNILAGFDHPSRGTVTLDGKPLASADRAAHPGPDRIVVFQEGALFPWKTVLDNVTYGLKVQRRTAPEEARTRALDMLARCGGLDRVAHQFPGQISSGMQRRVELVRALINDPRMLLLDEPFRAMDTVSKGRMHQHLLDIHAQFPKTVFFITHDLEEAILLADTVAVMTTRPGRIRSRVAVGLPRPRHARMVASEQFVALKEQLIAAVHEEAQKAFERGERELA
jgi:NitT/TauT family transport system ATP-binding protein